MRINQVISRQPTELGCALTALAGRPIDLLLVFGAVGHFTHSAFHQALSDLAPYASLLGCSTAGQISAAGVDNDTCCITAIDFDKASPNPASTIRNGMDDSFAAGQRIGRQIQAADLKAVLVFGPGVQINGSALVDGISSIIGVDIPITGGLAGDGGAFKETFTLGQEGVSNNAVVAIGLRGDSLRFGHGSFGGWEPFGPARKVTRSEGNVLYELDGKPALEIYKRYLVDHARSLPASGLLFPFAMLGDNHNSIGLIRTILGVDEAQGSLILAGEIDANGYLRLMHASTDKLVNGAEAAAEAATAMFQSAGETLAILISCVGRKLVMGSRGEEEVEAVGDVFSNKATLAGFYSYGEISPFTSGSPCKLHNQTMTVTCLGET